MTPIIRSHPVAAFTALALLSSPALALDDYLPKVEIDGKSSPRFDVAEMQRFETAGPIGGYDDAKALAKRLFDYVGLDARAEPRFNETGTALMVQSKDVPTRYLRINTKTGDLSFNRGMDRYMKPGTTPGLPVEGEAIDVAFGHLKALGLGPEDWSQLVVQAVGGLGMGVSDEKGRTRQYEKLTAVHFARQIDGVDVGGPGSKIVVYLGSDGELVGLHRRWGELRDAYGISKRSVLKPAEIEQRAVEHLQKEWYEASHILTKAPDLGYYDDGKGRIEPAYFLQAEVAYDPASDQGAAIGEEPLSYLGVIPATRFSGADLRQRDPAQDKPEIELGAEPADKPDRYGE
jgi:hypothetical protein